LFFAVGLFHMYIFYFSSKGMLISVFFVHILVYVMSFFSVSFLCGIYHRRSVMLGTERRWPSDACVFVFVFERLKCVADGDLFLCDEVFCLQIAGGTTTQRNTPVGVVGLSSGIVMVALGWVRFLFRFLFV
jgi:hypothetical protein